MRKRILSMLTLGVAAVAVSGFGMPAEGGLFGFFRHGHHGGGYVADCGYAGACGYVDRCACPPSCAPMPYRASSTPRYAPTYYGACAAPPVYPPQHACGYDARGYDFDDDDDCDDDD